MTIDITKYESRILEVTKANSWDLANKILYDLCESYPKHKSDEEIIAKLFLIGRSYAASIERRKNKKKNESSDDFYLKLVAPEIRESMIDKWLLALNNESEINKQNILKILETHGNLTTLFHKLTKLNKRSLSSKYLHFHRPNLFFIYDGLASSALGKFVGKILKQNPYNIFLSDNNVDKDYSKFFIKCLMLRDEISNKLSVNLTPRQLDNFLIDISNNGI